MNLPLPPQLLPLLAALVAGAVIGWLVPDPWRNRQRRFSSIDDGTDAGTDDPASEGLEAQLEETRRTVALLEAELQETRASQELDGPSAGTVSSEIDDLQAMVQDLTERAEQAERDRDRARERSEDLNAKVHKQQRQLDEAADRIVSFEREKLQKGGRSPFRLSRSAKKPVDLEIVGEEIEDTDSSKSGEALGLEIEDSTTPIDQPAGLVPPAPEPELELEIEKPGPIMVETDGEDWDDDLQIERAGEGMLPPRAETPVEEESATRESDPSQATSSADVAADEPEIEVEMEGLEDRAASPDESAKEVGEGAEAGEQLTGEPGAAHPLQDVTGMSDDLAERFELIAVHSTLDLVRKAATRKSVNRLAISMSLEPKELERWVSFADLLRIERLRKDDIKPLVDLGIRTVQKLAESDAESLARKLTKGGRNDKAPTQEIVTKWIDRARELEPMVRW